MIKVFVQFSSSYNGELSPVMEHLSKVLPAVGLPYDEHFLEHPTWISWVSGIMAGVAGEEVFVLLASDADLMLVLHCLLKATDKVMLFGSVLDANKHHWHYLLHQLPPDITVLLGGYINPAELEIGRMENVHWLTSLNDLAEWGGDVKAAPCYSLLEEYEALPRLTMSTGCLFRCTFCTIAPTVRELSYSQIANQVASFEGLKFRYIYLDDKTFGQAATWATLGVFGGQVRRYNPDFRGFIIQTTVGELYQKYDAFIRQGVVMAEIGVEIPEDGFLARMNKPYRRQALDKLMALQTERFISGKPIIKIIPNLLFGVPGDDYVATLSWLRENVHLISHVNFFILSYYEDAKNPEALVEVHGVGDDDENSSGRTWLTQAEVDSLEEAMAEAMSLVERKWGG